MADPRPASSRKMNDLTWIAKVHKKKHASCLRVRSRLLRWWTGPN